MPLPCHSEPAVFWRCEESDSPHYSLPPSTFSSPLCFHTLTNCFSRNPFLFTSIQIPRGVGGVRSRSGVAHRAKQERSSRQTRIHRAKREWRGKMGVKAFALASPFVAQRPPTLTAPPGARPVSPLSSAKTRILPRPTGLARWRLREVLPRPKRVRCGGGQFLLPIRKPTNAPQDDRPSDRAG
jgi:hypothetical protein